MDVNGAERFVRFHGGILKERSDQSIAELLQKNNAEAVVVFEEGLPSLYGKGCKAPFRFYLNIASLRLQNVMRGQVDRFLKISGIESGMNILDCTLGLGSDALLAAWKVGNTGKVIGLEASKPIAAILESSFHYYSAQEAPILSELTRRITIIPKEIIEFSASQEKKSFDIVYMDPMFDKPREKSDGIFPLRFWAFEKPMERQSISEALALSRNQLIIKEGKASKWWEELNMPYQNKLTGQRYHSVRYRIIEREKG